MTPIELKYKIEQAASVDIKYSEDEEMDSYVYTYTVGIGIPRSEVDNMDGNSFECMQLVGQIISIIL